MEITTPTPPTIYSSGGGSSPSLDGIEDQLFDIETALSNIATNTTQEVGWWQQQQMELTKLYLKDLLELAHKKKTPLTGDDVVGLAALAAKVGAASLVAIKEHFPAWPDIMRQRYNSAATS